MTWEGLTPPYATIVADCPWAYPANQRRAPARDRYSTLTVDELAALDVGSLAADDAHLWLWVTARGMAEGWHVPLIEAWGFRPQGAVVTWCKTGQPGVGAVVRCNVEFAVLAVRGRPPVPAQPAMSAWQASGRVHSGRYAHSTKPAWFYDMVEQVSPGPRCELFQRQGRLGWDGWGLGHEARRSA